MLIITPIYPQAFILDVNITGCQFAW